MPESSFDISIITPCFNAGNLIGELAESLKCQTFKNFQWCIVDDGSAAQTRNIIENLANDCSLSIRTHFADKSGGNFCRNKGFALSQGSFVKFVDADDLLDCELLQCQIEIAKQNQDSIVVSPTTVLTDNGKRQPYYLSPELLDDPLRSYLRHPTFMHGGCLLPRDLVTKAGGWDEALTAGQDLDFFRRVLATNPRVTFAGSSFCYRQHQSAPRISKLTPKDVEKFESQFAGLDKFQNQLQRMNKLPDYRVELAKNFDLWGMKAIAFGMPNSTEFLNRAKTLSPSDFRSGSKMAQGLRSLIGDRLTAKLMRSQLWKSAHAILTRLNLWPT